MRKKFVQIAAVCLLAGLVLSLAWWGAPSASAASDSQRIVRVGLYYGSSAMDGANLLNEVGAGFRFGYFDGNNQFLSLGSTQERAISIVKTENVYYGTYDKYTSYHDNITSSVAVGCYHTQLPGSYGTFAEAQAVAGGYADGFVAYIGGAFYARVGNFTTRAGAVNRQAELSSAGVSATIVGTSAYGVSAVITGTNTIVFQYDDLGEGTGLGVMPNAAGDTGEDFVTWFKGYSRRGGFRYERIGGGDLTIVSILSMEHYLKGVVPYEMSTSWHLEALKAQAVAARTYAIANLNRHSAYHFDLCGSTHCQVYYGTNKAGPNSDQAVEQTDGQVAMYNGKYADCVYYSSNGGASIDSSIPWGGNQSSYPYLVGVRDPYEAALADRISLYEWSRSYSGDEIAQAVRNAGYANCSTVVSISVSRYTAVGLPWMITLTDANGRNFTISTRALVSFFGLRSYNYEILGSDGSGTGSGDGQIYVNGQAVSGLEGLYAIGGDGSITLLGEGAYVMDGNGEVVSAGSLSGSSDGPSSATGGQFTFHGRGWGHNVGMSQWGAYAQALQGRTYEEILKFYYTGITITTVG